MSAAVELHTTKALRRLRDVAGVSICDYAADFDRLWQLDRPDLWEMGQPSPDHAVIVWDDTPIDPTVRPVNTEPHVTPFDWAIAARKRHSSLRITVLDLRTRPNDSRYPALRWFRTQRPEYVTWLRRLEIAQILDAEEQATADAPANSGNEMRLAALRKVLFHWDSADFTGAVDADDALEILWRHIRISGAGHHAIANLVGPMLLLPDLPKTGHREALRQLLVAAGRAPSATTLGQIDASLRGVLRSVAPLRIVMIDDQWHHGWAQWVSGLMGLKWDGAAARKLASTVSHDSTETPGVPQRVAGTDDNTVTLWVTGAVATSAAAAWTSPGDRQRAQSWLLDRIDAAISTDSGSDGRFRLRLTPGDEDVSEILLLDLRLFQTAVTHKSFVRSLAQTARRFVVAGAWPVLRSTELDELEAWTLGRAEISEAAVLTLLPRVLAHIDLSFPIVLFSSTGRRDVVESLSGYGSIVTRFAKPRLQDEASTVAWDATTALSAALHSAARIVAARDVCKRAVLATRPSALATASAATQLQATTSSPVRRTEIYLEESGAGHWMQVGGLIAQYSDAQAAAQFSLDLRQAGLVWGHDCDATTAPMPGTRQKKASDIGSMRTISERLEQLSELARLKGVGLSAFLVRGTRELEQDDVLRAGSPDHVYRALVRDALECALFVWPGTRAPNTEIAVYVATRLRHLRDHAAYQELQDRWGIDFRQFGAFVFNFDDAYPIVTELLGDRPADRVKPNMAVAKGVGFRYYPETTNIDGPKLPRQLHYAADWVASCPICVPSSWWNDGFREVSDRCFEAMLDAARFADWGDKVQSLAKWRASECGIGANSISMSAARWVRAQVVQCAEALSGNMLIELGKVLATEKSTTLPTDVMVKGVLQTHSRIDVENAVANVLGEDQRRIVKVRAVEDRYPRDPRRPQFIVYVGFAEHDHARSAMLLADGREVLGHEISITFAKS